MEGVTSLAGIKIRLTDCLPHGMLELSSGFSRFVFKPIGRTGFQNVNIDYGNDLHGDYFDT